MKLMAVFGLAMFAYAFVSGLWVTERGVETDTGFELDLRAISPGELKLVEVGRRTLLVLHRTPSMLDVILREEATRLLEPDSVRNMSADMDHRYRSLQEAFFIAYAFDPFYGCAIELAGDVFKSVCVDARYDLAGRAYKQSKAQVNLIVPDYEITNYLLRLRFY